jgi:hypothetical protein
MIEKATLESFDASGSGLTQAQLDTLEGNIMQWVDNYHPYRGGCCRLSSLKGDLR